MEKKGITITLSLITACYMIASVIVSWILYTHGRVLLIFPLLSTVISMASLVLLISLYAFFGCDRARPPSAFKAQETRIQRICFPFMRVTEEDLVAATANFSHRKIIGRGRFGVVYRGILSDGQVVAIKRIKSSPLAKEHFLSELHVLGQLRHRNLLKIFGLAQVVSNNQRTQISSLNESTLTFTVSYAAPEKAFVGVKTSPKADVYSYGILLLELISGLKPTSSTLLEMGVTISQWATIAVSENNCIELIDSCLRSNPEFHNEIQRVVKIGIHCTHESPQMRPSMKDVVKMLDEVMGQKEWNIPLYVLAHQELQMQESRLMDSQLTSD